jgi:DNA primase
MQLEALIDQVKGKLGAYRTRGAELVFKDCPFCGNAKWNFEFNTSKILGHCWVCGKGVSLQYLLWILDIQFIGELPKTTRKNIHSREELVGELRLPAGTIPIEQCKIKDKVIGYLSSRGITEEDIKIYEIMWCEYQMSPEGKRIEMQRVLFPFRNSVGNLIFWTARTIYKGVKPKYLGCSSVKSDRIIMYKGIRSEPVMVVEGVFDAIRVNKDGYSVVILLGSGLYENVVSYLRFMKRKVCLVLDSDMISKQQKYADFLEKELGYGMVDAVYLPEKDVAEKGMASGYHGFSGYIKAKLMKA